MLSLFLYSYHILGTYATLELCFYFRFRYHLLPFINHRIPPQDYRDYGRDRKKLFFRIVQRSLRTIEWISRHEDNDSSIIDKDDAKYPDVCFDTKNGSEFSKGHGQGQGQKQGQGQGQEQGHPRKQEENEKLKSAFNSLVHNFFLHTTPTSISTYNPNNPNHGYILKKTDIDVLMSWAFFGKETHELEAWEEDEKQKMFDFLEREHDITFEPGTSNCLKPCLQSVDPVIPYYKPFFVYLVTMTIKFMCRISLRLLGFQYCETSSGMTYWMRLPSTTKASNTIHDSDNDSPFIFFHGLSPGGYGFYLPFLLRGILRDKPNVPVLLFETPIITCTKSFQIFSEQETVEGVLEAIHKHFDTASNNKTKVTLCGHSFGSVQLTWLVRSIPDRIGQLILMDPISLLLSDGVAMVNFLYKRYCYSNYDTKSMLSTTKPKTTEGTFQDDQRHQTPSQSFTSSEIGIEYYVRRHFSWYNSELWLEDIPNHVKTHVFLSGQDEIINAPHVKREIIIHNEFVDTNQQIKNGPPKIDLTYWPNDGHGYCVLSSERWTEIRERIFNPPIFDNFKKND